MEKKKLTWYDVTLRQYQAIKSMDLDDVENQVRAAEILLDISADDMTVKEFAGMLEALDFLSDPIPKEIIRTSYTINGRKYDMTMRFDELTVAQFMDFQNLSKEGELNRILSVFLIPEGHSYADYDIERVFNDMLDLNVVDATAISCFFQMALGLCLRAITDCSMKEMRKMTRKDREVIRKALESVSTDFCSMSGV